MSLLELFCDVDDFCREWHRNHPKRLVSAKGQRVRQPGLKESEIMTLVIYFHQSGYRNFKEYYTKHVMVHLRAEFPQLVSYARFVTLMQRVVLLLWAYAQSGCGACTGIAFIDSTALRVCTNQRIHRHKVFAGLAARGHCSLGWFYGFKLHIICNTLMQILSFRITAGNTDDRKALNKMWNTIFGLIIADAGYLGKNWQEKASSLGKHLFTAVKANMKKIMAEAQRQLLNIRQRVETVFSVLKVRLGLETSLPRPPLGHFAHYIWCITAYQVDQFFAFLFRKTLILPKVKPFLA